MQKKTAELIGWFNAERPTQLTRDGEDNLNIAGFRQQGIVDEMPLLVSVTA